MRGVRHGKQRSQLEPVEDGAPTFVDAVQRQVQSCLKPLVHAVRPLDQIVGIVYAKDVLKAIRQNGENTKVADLVRPARFVPESKKCAELLREMQRKKFHIALVTDEYGSISGLVTLEDLLEELVGEITDEYDRDEPQMEPVGDDTYRVNGRLTIDELNELLEVELPHEEWDTVAGLMLGLLGAIPTEGEEVRFDRLSFTAEQVQGRRVAKVLISRLPQEPQEEDAEARADQS